MPKRSTGKLLLYRMSALVGGGAAGLCAAQPQPELYRPGMPQVMEPALARATSEAPFNQDVFAAAYARAGRPAMAVLWNRELSDLLEQPVQDQITVDGSSSTRAFMQAPARGVGGSAGTSTESSIVVRAGPTRGQQGLRTAPVERVDLQMRGAFVQTLIAAGAQIVDRNVVMRSVAREPGQSDAQKVEFEALGRHAKLVVQVLNTPDTASPTGWSTSVSVKRLADGVVLAEGYVDAVTPDASPQRYEADPNGGFRVVAAPAARPADMGRAAAHHVLARMADALRTRP